MIEDLAAPTMKETTISLPEEEEDEPVPEISFHTIARTKHPQTIRVNLEEQTFDRAHRWR